MKKITYYNQKLLILLSAFLNNNEKIINIKQIKEVCKTGVDEETAYRYLLEAYCELDDHDEEFINLYFPYIIRKLDPNIYKKNDYYQNIDFSKLNNNKNHAWKLKIASYKAYEAFVWNDYQYLKDGRVIPQIGFFNVPFCYPAIYENNRLWMSITPNEISTMQDVIDEVKGNVATIGLGLGYFAYMVTNKEDVISITIIERDQSVIKLFSETILPQFKHPEKVKIIEEDAFSFLENNMNELTFDYLFCDIWHDVGDGLELYLKLKPFEVRYPNTKFDYWIEKTIKYYL